MTYNLQYFGGRGSGSSSGGTSAPQGRVTELNTDGKTGDLVALSVYAVYRDFDRGKSRVSDVNITNLKTTKRNNALKYVDRQISITENNIKLGRGDATDLNKQLGFWQKTRRKLS